MLDAAVSRADVFLGIRNVVAVARNQHVTLSAGLRERVDVTEVNLSTASWQRYSCGKGSKGPRFYDWAYVHIDEAGPGVHRLLIRRNRAGELAFYLCWTPTPVPLTALVTAAGARWAVEETFQIGKGQVGLDHTTAEPPPPPGLAPMSVPEARRLLTTLTSTATNPRAAIGWSLWRRHHIAAARASHHKRRMIVESEHVTRRTETAGLD